MPPAKKPADPILSLSEDVAAVKELLEYARANHWTISGEVLVGRIRLGGVSDTHPRTLLEQRGVESLPKPDDDPLADFR